MRTRLRRWNVLSWPIWIKFLVGFGLALVLVVLPAVFLIREGMVELGLQNGRTFVSQNGVQQVNAISRALDIASTTLDSFVNEETNQRILIGMLLGPVRTDVQLNYPSVTRADVETLLTGALLNPATSTFENTRLLNRAGRVIARSSVATLTGTENLEDESGSPAYLAALSSQTRSRLLNVSFTSGSPVLEYIQPLQWRDGTVLGYLVTQVNNIRAIAFNLNFTDTTYPGQVYLIDSRGGIVDTVPNSIASIPPTREILDRALLGQTGVDVYTRPNGDEVIGYYSSIRGTSLALLNELPTSVAVEQTLGGFATRIFVVAISAVALLGIVVLLFHNMIVPPLNRLRRAAQQLAEGSFDTLITDTRRGDEIGALAHAFSNMRDAVRDLVEDLETRIAARTRDIGATQEISRFAATQRDVQVLMDRVVDLILERFSSIYHAQIFLIDSDQEYAIVRASTGEVGKQLIARGHRLSVGSISVIGQVTEQGRYILARDTAASQVHRRNEFLPDTRAELAIPLRVGDDIIGALDVQSRQPDVFTPDLIGVLQTMADQIAVAIQNANLYEESMRRVLEIEESNRQSTLLAWQEYMRDQRLTELSADAGVTSLPAHADLRQAALTQGRLVIGQTTDRQTIPIAVPIQLRGQTLGAVEWELPAQGFGDDKLELAQELANRLALSLDNARLFQESRRATERERLVNTIASKLTAQTTIDTILQTAVREVGQALRAPQVRIRLHSESVPNGNGNGHSHYPDENPNE